MLTMRERLLTAMRRGSPDRIPFTFDSTPECREKLRAHLGLATAAEVPAFLGCDHFGSVNTVTGSGAIHWNLPTSRPDGTPVTIWGTPMKKIEYPGGAYWEYDTPPLAQAQSVADIEAYAWPDPSKVVFEPLPAPEIWKPRHAATVIGDSSFIGPFGIAFQVRGMEALMLDMIENPAMVEALVARIESFTLPLLKRFLDTYRGAVDFVCCGDDLGTQLGLLIGRNHFQQFFAPSLKRHFAEARSRGVICYQHCCGAICDIIPDLIDCGVEVLNPIQVRAVGMDPARLKREFGAHLAFHGAIDVQHTLPCGTTDDVRREVRQRVAELGPDGYILCSSHGMQTDIPPANIIAMYDEIQKIGREMNGSGCTGGAGRGGTTVNDRVEIAKGIETVKGRIGASAWDRLLSHLDALNRDICNRGFAWWEPTKRHLLTGYDYGQYYDWDLYYEGIYASYNGLHDCYNANLEVFFSLQRHDGFIQRAFGSKPWGTEQLFKPFIAQIVQLSQAQKPDSAWLGRYYRQIERFLEHWATACDGDGNGLCYWSGGADQSGMDNQSSRCGHTSGRSEGVDLNCYLVREYEAMALLAEQLRRPSDADTWRAKAAALRDRINELLWDEADGFYYDRDEQTGQRIRVKSVSCFTPLWARVASCTQAARMIFEHLVNPAEFWLTYPVASYARTEPDYFQGAPCCNWRGCTWIPTNHMIVHGLRHYGHLGLARDLAYKTLELALVNPVTREFYNAETGKGYGCNPFYGWSSLAYLLPFEVELAFDPTALQSGIRIPNLMSELGVPPVGLPARPATPSITGHADHPNQSKLKGS